MEIEIDNKTEDLPHTHFSDHWFISQASQGHFNSAEIISIIFRYKKSTNLKKPRFSEDKILRESWVTVTQKLH